MSVLLTFGEFSRMTHLSVKALRHRMALFSPIRADAIPATRT